MPPLLRSHRRSFKETTVLATGGAALLAVLLGTTLYQWQRISADSAWMVRIALVLVSLVLAALGAFAALVAIGGCVVLYRDWCEDSGLPYVASVRPRERIVGPMVSALRRFLHPRGRLHPGELVEVRSLPEILATLDTQGCLDGLPFMSEMVAYCGQRYPVMRRVDKVWEYAHGSGMRRMRDAVLLKTVRCDGGGHGGCQAGCQLIWKEAWLRPAVMAPRRISLSSSQPGAAVHVATQDGQRYACQMTEIREASTQLGARDLGHYWRDLIRGNIRFLPLVCELSIRMFNSTQWRLSRPMWPVFQPAAGDSSPYQALGLQPGQIVRVKSKHEIERTLNREFRNRGLEFGSDMLFYCGGSYRVAARVDRIVHEATGNMLTFKTPSIVLEGVTAIGGSIVSPQNEFYFWREIWLEPQSPTVLSPNPE